MSMKITVICTWCGKSVEKEQREMTRSLKRGRLPFCNGHCAASYRNIGRKFKEFITVCACGNQFHTNARKKSKKHCSRSCASRFSMTEKRKLAYL